MVDRRPKEVLSVLKTILTRYPGLRVGQVIAGASSLTTQNLCAIEDKDLVDYLLQYAGENYAEENYGR